MKIWNIEYWILLYFSLFEYDTKSAERLFQIIDQIKIIKIKVIFENCSFGQVQNIDNENV